MKYNYLSTSDIILTAQTERERHKQGLGLPCTGIIQILICVFIRYEEKQRETGVE